jgi:hypothetical protein
LKDARQLGCSPADESEPYKFRYAAADALKELQEQVQHASAETPAGEGANEVQAAERVAWCKLERGLQLLETDLLSEGQKALEQGLEYAWPGTVECLAIQLQAHNALASLWCERSENGTALQHLRSADDLYSRISTLQQTAQPSPAVEQQQEAQQHVHAEQLQQPAEEHAVAAVGPPAAATDTAAANGGAASPSASSSSRRSALIDADQVERDRTTTLFYLAQVYGLRGDKMQSASYCAATLNRQLKQGKQGAWASCALRSSPASASSVLNTDISWCTAAGCSICQQFVMFLCISSPVAVGVLAVPQLHCKATTCCYCPAISHPLMLCCLHVQMNVT